MTELKLQKLPDRTPIKLTISITPDLNQSLADYADLYTKAYGQAEAVADLVPYMLRSFLEGDRGFAKARQSGTSR
jgi:hypothetical protein